MIVEVHTGGTEGTEKGRHGGAEATEKHGGSHERMRLLASRNARQG